MNKQEIFDKALNAVVAQGKKSRHKRKIDGSTCAYRAADGCRCAIGHLIPDELYDPKMEGQNVHALTLDYPKVADLFGIDWKLKPRDADNDAWFLWDIQQAHDHTIGNAKFVENFKKRMKAIAVKEKLNWSD